MKTPSMYYEEADIALNRYNVCLKEFTKCIEENTIAEINYDSVLAMVTKELENTTTSKTSLREIVRGDKRVLEANENLLKTKANKEVVKEKMRFLDMRYSLEKKMIDAVRDEMKII